jgi:hypothetical protein
MDDYSKVRELFLHGRMSESAGFDWCIRQDRDTEIGVLKRRYYRWWTVKSGRDFVKLGPLSVTWYRWSDGRWRVGVLWNFGHERIVYGGPLA